LAKNFVGQVRRQVNVDGKKKYPLMQAKQAFAPVHTEQILLQ
jgi:hypothetical protein